MPTLSKADKKNTLKPINLKKIVDFKNMSVKAKHNLLRTAAAIGIGLSVALVLILLTAENPGQAVKYFLAAPFLSKSYFSHLIEVIIPLLFTGSAVCIMFSANQFNLGLEGAVYLGGLVAAISGIYLVTEIPFISPMVGILLGGIVGAIITLIPALLQYKWKANVLVSSLMMNYICLYVGLFLLFHFFKDPDSSQHTYPISEAAKLTSFFKGMNIHSGIIIAALVTIFSYLLLYRTRIGYSLRATGQNPTFAKYSGIGVGALAVFSQVIGGFIGGMGGAVQVLGLFDRFQWVALTGFGWDGVTIAIFAKNNPKYLPLATLFIAYFRTGAWVMSFKAGVQIDLVSVFEGIMVLFLLAEKFLSGTYKKMVFEDADRKRRERQALESNEKEVAQA